MMHCLPRVFSGGYPLRVSDWSCPLLVFGLFPLAPLFPRLVTYPLRCWPGPQHGGGALTFVGVPGTPRGDGAPFLRGGKVTGRWALTLKRDKDGNFLKTKARWVLRGFQDKQKNDLLLHPGVASALQSKQPQIRAGIYSTWICEMGYQPHIGARMKKPAYGLDDAPRRWWNILDSALRSYGLVPTRADRCTYVYYGKQVPKPALVSEKKSSNTFDLEGAVDYLMDPASGKNAKN